MDVVAGWAVRIATRVVPDELDFAAEVGQAYAAGGKARSDLFPRPGAEPGGFGVTAMTEELPVILQALADAAGTLRDLLATKELGNVVALVGLVVALRRGKSDVKSPEAAALDTAQHDLRAGLENSGLPGPRAEEVAYDLLEELLSDPDGAREFLRRLRGEEGEEDEG
jgi:hypothetical protein